MKCLIKIKNYLVNINNIIEISPIEEFETTFQDESSTSKWNDIKQYILRIETINTVKSYIFHDKSEALKIYNFIKDSFTWNL